MNNSNKEFFKEGQLRKEGGSVKSWKTRWCVIEDNHLLYYKNKKKKELKGINPAHAGVGISNKILANRFHLLEGRK